MSEGPNMPVANLKGVCWSITINNPTSDDLQQWESLKGNSWIRSTEGQMEQGENGTPHLQGMIRTLSVRFSQVKKALPRAHIEKARSEAALAKYVAKEETRVSEIPKTKVANQMDVQTALLDEVLLHGHKFFNWNGTYFLEFLESHGHKMAADWEVWLDRAVNRLIREGYYGVEFVMSNPQVRMAFKKYFVAILYRTYNARSPSNDQAQSPKGGSQD